MSRREAAETITVEQFEKTMDGIYSESVGESVLDEAPMAYKTASQIVSAIEPTATVVDWLDIQHNLKAIE